MTREVYIKGRQQGDALLALLRQARGDALVYGNGFLVIEPSGQVRRLDPRTVFVSEPAKLEVERLDKEAGR